MYSLWRALRSCQSYISPSRFLLPRHPINRRTRRSRFREPKSRIHTLPRQTPLPRAIDSCRSPSLFINRTSSSTPGSSRIVERRGEERRGRGRSAEFLGRRVWGYWLLCWWVGGSGRGWGEMGAYDSHVACFFYSVHYPFQFNSINNDAL